ncbi:5689_t:CDS:2 [Entrophospora sp. SA101]|nr:5689_t:CDS:2 [Entrophospora sp. SA101]
MLNSNNSSTTSLHQQFEELSLTSTTTTKESSLSYSYSPPSSPSFLENFGLPPTFQLDIEVPDFVLRRRNAIVEAIDIINIMLISGFVVAGSSNYIKELIVRFVVMDECDSESDNNSEISEDKDPFAFFSSKLRVSKMIRIIVLIEYPVTSL